MLNFGGFLSSNFWTNYRCQSSPSIEDMLNNKECSVDKLLDDDDCLQEFKNFNDKLIKYFDHDKLKVLIDYITVMPLEDEHNRGHKYPFLAGEVFNCEINQILDKFFEAPVKVKAVTAEAPAVENEDEDDVESNHSKEEDENRPAETATTDEETKDAVVPATTEEAKAGTPPAETVEPEAEVSTTTPPAEETKTETPATTTEEQKTEATTTPAETPVVDATAEPAETKKEETKEEKPEATATPVVEETKEEAKAEVPATTKVEDENPQEQAPVDAAPKEEAKTTTPEPNTQEAQPEGVKAEAPVAATTEEAKAETPAAAKTDAEKEKDPLATTYTTLATEATDATADEIDEEPENKYVLLDRLFKFIRTEGDEQLNPVLSGYFCKLVSILISRKCRQLVPYVFSPGSDLIEMLLKHVYQRSISEILNKLLTQIDMNDAEYETEVRAQITEKQKMAVSKLIDTLGPDYTEEHNLNSRTIIMDMFESKEYYNIICSKENLKKIVEFSTKAIPESTKASKMCSLIVLNQIVVSNIEKQKKKDKTDTDKAENQDEDDDVVQQNSDDENGEDLESTNPNSHTAQTNALVEMLKGKVAEITAVLQADHDLPKIGTSVCEETYVPLGQQRLYTVELVLRMVQMKKIVLYIAMGETGMFKNIMALVHKYQWNNFLQLKVIELCDEVLDNCDSDAFKKQFLEGSGIAKTLVDMSKDAAYKMESERLIRNGYMGLVVTISNKMIKKSEPTTEEGGESTKTEVGTYLEAVGEEWTNYVDGELKKSNENNNKTLGGSTTTPKEEDEDEKDSYDVQMEKIMARFTNFNQILSQSNSEDN